MNQTTYIRPLAEPRTHHDLSAVDAFSESLCIYPIVRVLKALFAGMSDQQKHAALATLGWEPVGFSGADPVVAVHLRVPYSVAEMHRNIGDAGIERILRAGLTRANLRPGNGIVWSEEQRQLVGEALSVKLAEMAGEDGSSPDWFDARNVDEVLDVVEAALRPSDKPAGFVKPDNDQQVFFYEQDYYVLSNFSAFSVQWGGYRYPTSEHLYHVEKFKNYRGDIADLIAAAPSAHEAFKLAERYKADRRPDWDEIKVAVMREILRAKIQQHEYVRRKLLATGDRELIEDSWRDDFWGWGPNRDGQNMLGKLWMEVRAELTANKGDKQ